MNLPICLKTCLFASSDDGVNLCGCAISSNVQFCMPTSSRLVMIPTSQIGATVFKLIDFATVIETKIVGYG